MSTERQRSERVILLSIAAFVPTIAMVPIGGYYVWKEGYVLYWALASLAWTTIVYLVQRAVLARPETAIVVSSQAAPDADALLPASIERLASTADVDRMTSSVGLSGLAEETLTLVARHFHPDRNDAIWQFTVPQALLITEQVSRRLQEEIVSKIPFGNRLTIAQVLNLYQFRSAFTVAEKLYDIWRLVRVVNPATAATHEARERLSKAAVAWGRNQVMRRLTRMYVEQVARAGMDLYMGRLLPHDAAKKDGAREEPQ